MSNGIPEGYGPGAVFAAKEMERIFKKQGRTMPDVSDEQMQREIELTREHCPLVLPPQWREEVFAPMARMFHRHDRLKVIYSVTCLIPGDSRPWIHLSLSRPDRIPSYEDMACVKKLFIGEERQAIQVFAPRAKHINIGKNVLHLWCCLEGDGLPDFGGYGTI